MEQETLSCPFCGKPPLLDSIPPQTNRGPNLEDYEFWVVIIECNKCGIEMSAESKDYESAKKDALRKWNTRSDG